MVEVTVCVGDEVLAAIDAKADRIGMSRADLIPILLADAIQSEMSSD